MTSQHLESSPRLKVSAANPGIKAFVTAPKNLKILGIVRFGMEFGLLAVGEAGNYVRVNGSQVVNLDTRAVREALRAAGLSDDEPSFNDAPAEKRLVTAPTVVIRKRRTLVPALQLQ